VKDRMIKIRVREHMNGWVWCILNSRGEEITISRRAYSDEKKAIRSARYYAKLLTCCFFVLGENK